MFKTKDLSVRIALAFGGSVLLALNAAAQSSEPQKLERVEITGSSIKRIAKEGALPVQVINAEQIRASGASSVADVIQKLPAMQGFQVADIAIGTNSGGIATASIHDLGGAYTLVLLNGRRIAPSDSGSTINLNAIPMSAIERIEVLTDGASALYGSDAIAGVVNFVLKKSHKGGTITVQADKPEQKGGTSSNVSLTYGFGDRDQDPFNVVATYRHDDQKQMKSGDRDFAKSAWVPFTYNGKNYIYDRTSTSAVPANATVTFNGGLPSYSFNPYQKANGQCAPNNYYSLANAVTATSITEMCAFDFVSTIDIYPQSKRDSFYASGEFRANSSLKFTSDVALSRLDLIARIAPNPVPVAIPTTSSFYTTYVMPYLSAAQQANVKAVSASYRASDFGTRDSQTITDSKHFAFGAEAELANWNLSSSLIWSQNAIDERYVGGYFRTKEFTDLVSAVAFDPFVEAGKATPEVRAKMKSAIYDGTIRETSTTLKGVDVRGSRDLLQLSGGMAQIGIGADFRKMSYKQQASADAKAGVIYNYSAVADYDMERDTKGVFAEVMAPVLKGVELSAAVRYDSIDAISDNLKSKTVGKDMSAGTYKLSGRWEASKQWLFRGSYGTGFKAPAMLDIAQPLVSAGVTASNYDCPFPGTDACKPGKLQYSVLSGGNDQLKPEKSKQATIGFRFEPSANLTFGLDLWQVKLRDAVSGVTEKQAFGDAAKYAALFTTFRTPAETQDYYAFKRVSTNIGRTTNRGIDWDAQTRFDSVMGKVTLGVAGTHMLKSSYTRAGTDDVWVDSMSHYGENAAVTFRNVARTTIKIDHNKQLANTVVFKYRSGYTDITQTVRDVTTGKLTTVTLPVPSYMTIDWQMQYKYNKGTEVRLGINNLTNQTPPFTLRDSSGHQVGYDARYADPKLRTFYVQGSYSF